MNLPDLAIKRPIFISCIFILSIILGIFSLSRLGVDLFPNVNFPVVVISTNFMGASPEEIESLISKPIEDTLSTLPGIQKISSDNSEGISVVITEFTLETNSREAEQLVKDKMFTLRSRLPEDASDPYIRSFDPMEQPILVLSITADLASTDLYDLADQEIRPLIEQIKDVGSVNLFGGRRKEIHVLLDRELLKKKGISATAVVSQLGASGKNIPAGKSKTGERESIVRTIGEYNSVKSVENSLVYFYGNEVPTRVKDVGRVTEGLEDEFSRTLVNGNPALTLRVLKRSGSNTVEVAENVKKRINKINSDLKSRFKDFDITIVHDGGEPIKKNVNDVKESILLGIFLTIIVVFLFLGNIRSTLITGLALPNSLLGAFILMAIAGFTVNIMTLLALSLTVGLLIDDAIVVRENIFRHIELGKTPKEAASFGTKEVTLAVISTSLTVMAVFGPIAFMDGIIGQFFKEFGLTVCFAMLISLLDALTMAPMLSAYFAGKTKNVTKNRFSILISIILNYFEQFQIWLQKIYIKSLGFTLNKPLITLGSALLIFILSFGALYKIPKTFIPSQDTGEFNVSLELPPGTPLEKTNNVAIDLDKIIRSHPEVHRTIVTIGGRTGEVNEGRISVELTPINKRKASTNEMKALIRVDLKAFEFARAKISGGGGRGTNQPFNVNIIGSDIAVLKNISHEIILRLKENKDLKDVDMNYREGTPEFKISLDKNKAEEYGVNPSIIGQELRTQIEGAVPALYKINGKEYNIRVRLKEDQRNIKESFAGILIPNINQRLIRLTDVASGKEELGPTTISRQNRSRYIQISADIDSKGKGLGHAIQNLKSKFEKSEIKLPQGVSYEFVGQAENLQELISNILMAGIMAILFIYLVLASLYESFIIPFAILLVLPLAICGAFYALAITGSSLDLFSMIGCIMLLGVATKNSILLVDYINNQIQKGLELKEAIIEAGKVRLRPIIMTSLALIAGMLPLAIGLNEASRERGSMGIAVIGGLISSTLLSLIVIPAAYSYVEKLRRWVNKFYLQLSSKTNQA